MRFIFLIIAFLCLIGWLIGWVAFHIASGLIQILFAVAIVAFIFHLVYGRRSAV